MSNNQATQQKKSEYKGFTIKEKLLPVILLSLAAPFMVFFFGPFEIFGNNMDQFKFAFWDFWLICALMVLGVAAVLCAVLLLLRGRAFDVVYGLVFGTSLMIFIQGNFLSMGMSSLAGDGNNEQGLAFGDLFVNTAIWVLIIGGSIAAILLLNRYRDMVKLISTVVLIAVFGSTLISFAVLALTTDVLADREMVGTQQQGEDDEGYSIVNEWTSTKKELDLCSTPEIKDDKSNVVQTIGSSKRILRVGIHPESGWSKVSVDGEIYYALSEHIAEQEGERVLTVKNLDVLAKEQNVIVFIVDRFDYSYYQDAAKHYPEIFAELEGFTSFEDYITLYPRTFPGVLHVLTGVETDFTLSHDEYMTHAYENSEHLQAIKQAGFDVNIYTDDYYCYDNASVMSAYADNVSGLVSYRVQETASLSMDMIRLSLYRYLPFCAQGVVGNVNTPMFDKYVVYDMPNDIYSTDMRKVYELLNEDGLVLGNYDKGYSFIHIDGCHKSTIYDSDFNEIPADDPDNLAWSTENVMRQSFKVISYYLAEMKRLGVYEDATIIITGDHAAIRSDTKVPDNVYVTGLFVKPAGKSEGELVKNYAQLDVDNVLATIKEAVGIPTDEPTVFEVPEGVDQTRYLMFQRWPSSDKGETSWEYIVYEIVGNGKDFANWEIVSRESGKNSIYK